MLPVSRFTSAHYRPVIHCLCWTRRNLASGSRSSFPEPPRLQSLNTPEDSAQARAWISRFKSEQILKGLVELTFSRSSGPGGQNVNKVNTKVSLRCPLESSWIPLWAHSYIRDSPHYVSSSKSIFLTSTISRSQAQNIDDCLSKLHSLVLSASSASIKNEPSEEQRRRVVELAKSEKASRRKEKSYRSQVKKGRARPEGAGWD